MPPTRSRRADTPMTGAFAGKNLILIMMESVDDWLVTPEYMPNLYRLEQEGVYFRNYYAPIFLAAATFNSEFTGEYRHDRAGVSGAQFVLQ